MYPIKFLPIMPKMGILMLKMGISMNEAINIGQALFPLVKRRILTLTFTNPEGRWSVTEIIKSTGNSSGAVQRELQRLVKSGILIAEITKRRKFYGANTDCMIYTELRQIVIKTFGVADTIRELLMKKQSQIKLALIYGSLAANTDTGASDIDILVVGNISLRELVAVTNESEEILGRTANPTLYSVSEFRNTIFHKNHFISSILKAPKLFLIGDENDIKRLAGKPLG